MSSREPASESLDAGLLGVRRTLCLWWPGHKEKAKHVATWNLANHPRNNLDIDEISSERSEITFGKGKPSFL